MRGSSRFDSSSGPSSFCAALATSGLAMRPRVRDAARRACPAVYAGACERLEDRRLLSVTITGSVTLDESAGLQNSGTAVGAEDNNDSDVAVASLPSAFSSRLFGAPAAGLGLSNAFPAQVGVGRSAENYITVTATGAITSLGFAKADGSALPVYAGAATGGVASGLSAVAGGAISLFADASLGNRMVLGVDTTNQIALAMFMEPNATLTSARVWTVQLEALSNPDATTPDDPVALAGLGVGAGVSTEFNFNALPSGQNLFGTVGNASTALVVIGKTPVLNADGTFTNASNTINTSQGGGPTTIGVNNQMFDPGDGAYFTFVKNPDPNFLAGAPGGLDQNEADDADNIVFQNRLEALGGFVKIAQIQGNSAATLKISLFNGGDSDNINNNDDQRVFTDTGLGTGSAATITKITVMNQLGQVVQTLTGSAAAAGVVSGLDANYRVAWESSAAHDQVLIDGVAGKFDIGGFGVNEPSSELSPLSGVRFEDDGPSITATAQGAPTLTVDETVLGTDATGAFAAQFTPAFGADGPGATSVAYALSTPGGNSGLVDTATGQAVVLSLVAGQVQGRTATSNDLVFTVSVDGSGNVTLDQQRAVVHPDTSSHDESVTLAAANQAVLTATAADGDADTAAAPLNIGQLLNFEDDGPSITATATGAPTMTVDETVLGTDDTKNFAGQFTPTFGADGPGATPRSYALATPGGASGLVDTASNQSVTLSLSGGQVVGTASGQTVFVVSVDQSGNVTLDQRRSVRHADTNNHDDATGLVGTGLVVLTGRAHDGDGDSASANLDLTPLLVFEDDGPAVGPIENSVVDFAAGSSATKTLNGAVGADPNGAPYTVDSFTNSVTVNGVQLQGVASGNNTVVTYFADTGGNGIFGDAGDTAFYRLTLAQAGAGTYTFECLVDPPPANLVFDFDDLPSGQNLFGTVGDTSNALVVIGKTPVLNPDGTFTNASNTINTSQGGGGVTIGVNNQMFDPGDGAYFTYVKSPDANFLSGAPGGLDQNEADDADNILYAGGTLSATTASTTISQTQGNSAATMKITAFDVAGSPQGTDFVSGLAGGTPVTITSVKVNGLAVGFTPSGNGVVVGGLQAGDTIEWTTSAPHDRVLTECVAGKFDLGAFSITQAAPTPDQKLDFVVRATDGDGDSSTAGFSIGIDGTGVNDDGLVAGVNAPAGITASLFSTRPIDGHEALLA